MDEAQLGHIDSSEASNPHSYADVGHATVALGETLDVLTDFDGDSHSLVTGNELWRRGRCSS